MAIKGAVTLMVVMLYCCISSSVSGDCFKNCINEYSETGLYLDDYWLRQFCYVDCIRVAQSERISSEGKSITNVVLLCFYSEV